MLPSDQTQANPAKAQARKMLRMLCRFMLPIIQSPSGQKTDLTEALFGLEADEFITELENFIFGINSRSQPRTKDVTIEATFGEEKLPDSKDKATTSSSLDDKVDSGNTPTNQGMVLHHVLPVLVPLDSTEKDLGGGLESLRRHVTQKMPIRLLYFEPYKSNLKISLLERADIYNYLALKFRADFNQGWYDDQSFYVPANSEYAILSHTWNQAQGELTYGDWKNGSLDATQPKCQKLVNFCKAAWTNHGVTLGWIDTVCINKESSAELDESIRSMYAWYRSAKVCITYLAATDTLSDMRTDPWFTRGWTLQELLAPYRIKFYNKDWNQLSTASNNDKDTSIIQAEIKLATTITSEELQTFFYRTSISRKMQLAAKRQVTRGEDIAYCLMGIFDVSISTAYGEGADRAFFRLMEEILRTTRDVSDIFNWAGNRSAFGREPISFLFPPHPSNYLNRATTNDLLRWHSIEPLTLTHLGLRTPILLMPAIPLLHQAVLAYPLPIGDYYAAVSIVPCEKGFLGIPQYLPENYVLLDEGILGPEAIYEADMHIEFVRMTLTFGTLNVQEQGNSIRVPKTCLAVLLYQEVDTPSPGYKRIYTEKPIVFNLKKIRNNSDGNVDKDYLIERNQLEKHGMRLVTLYL